MIPVRQRHLLGWGCRCIPVVSVWGQHSLSNLRYVNTSTLSDHDSGRLPLFWHLLPSRWVANSMTEKRFYFCILWGFWWEGWWSAPLCQGCWTPKIQGTAITTRQTLRNRQPTLAAWHPSLASPPSPIVGISFPRRIAGSGGLMGRMEFTWFFERSWAFFWLFACGCLGRFKVSKDKV